MRSGFRNVAEMKTKVCPHCDEANSCSEECKDANRDWSPFGVWHCLLCQMPQSIYDPKGFGMDPIRCDYCGWDEATEPTIVDPLTP